MRHSYVRAYLVLAALLGISSALLGGCAPGGDGAVSALKWGCEGEFCDDADLRKIEQATAAHWNAGTGYENYTLGNMTFWAKAMLFIYEVPFKNGYSGRFLRAPNVGEMRCKYLRHECHVSHGTEICSDNWVNNDDIGSGNTFVYGEVYDFTITHISLGNGGGSVRLEGNVVDFTGAAFQRAASNTALEVRFSEGPGNIGTTGLKEIGDITSISYDANWNGMNSPTISYGQGQLEAVVPGVHSTGGLPQATQVSCGVDGGRSGLTVYRSWSIPEGEAYNFKTHLRKRLNEKLRLAVQEVTGG